MPQSVVESCGSALPKADRPQTPTPSSAAVFQRAQTRRPKTSLGSPRDASRAIGCCEALLSDRGDISGTSLANEALTAYQSLNGHAFSAFLDFLVNRCSPDPEVVLRCGVAYHREPSHANLVQLQRAVEPRRQELFRRLHLATNGTAALVDIRRRLLHRLNDNPRWAPIETDLVHLLRSWFNGGFLELRRIDANSPAVVLQSVINFEAVHQITSWRDLQRRLEADRRCFALFHPALPDEPIAFTELALTSELTASVQPLLDPDSPVSDPSSSTNAIFYSISSCHEGLRGIPFGNALIRRVVEELSREFPRLRLFATLSPVPGFRSWLTAMARDGARPVPELVDLVGRLEGSNWFQDDVQAAELKRALLPLCAFYLLESKRGQDPADPVARFHLGNGAQLRRLNWLSDCSVDGIQRSAGITANYVYRLSALERNHQTYASHHTVMASRRLESLAQNAALKVFPPS